MVKQQQSNVPCSMDASDRNPLSSVAQRTHGFHEQGIEPPLPFPQRQGNCHELFDCDDDGKAVSGCGRPREARSSADSTTSLSHRLGLMASPKAPSTSARIASASQRTMMALPIVLTRSACFCPRCCAVTHSCSVAVQGCIGPCRRVSFVKGNCLTFGK